MTRKHKSSNSLFFSGELADVKSRWVVKKPASRSSEDWDGSWLSSEAAAGSLEDVSPNRKPLLLLIGLVVTTSLALGLQLFNLQIVNGSRFAGLADGNRLRQKVTYAQRGRILDRRGEQLASNQASFQLTASPFLLPKDDIARAQLYASLAGYLKTSAVEIQTKAEARGLNHTQSLLIKDNISYEQALIVEQKIPDLPGFTLDAIPLRRYQSEAGLAHLLGYIGRVNEDELRDHSYLLPVDFIGKDGIEAQYDQKLRGQNGVVKTEVDASGRPLRVIGEQANRSGEDVALTINYELQKQLAAAIAEQMPKASSKRAAGVAMDPRTGEVLAMVSLPSYDNNLFTGGIEEKTYQGLLNNEAQPLNNKAMSASYPSGSIIKPMHLIGALQEGVVNENTTIVDNGKLVVRSQFDPNQTFVYNGWNLNGLGPMNARRAVALSSDIYFYTVGGGYENFRGMGIERLAKWYRAFGLGSPTGIDLPNESSGRVPTPEWKQQVKGEEWFTGDTYNVSIGQGDLLVSPLQMVRATAAVINDGELLRPVLYKGNSPQAKVSKVVDSKIPADSKNLQIAREGMRAVVSGGGTTSPSTFAGVPVTVAGKSGTAETNPTTQRRSHAWFTAYAPYENPEIVFCVLLEEGEGGSQFAAPAIAKTMQWYFGAGKNSR
jgi:penicillin-binding protein 2